MKKLCVSLVSLVVITLLAEGVLSLFLGTSLRRLGRGASLLERLQEQQPTSDRDSFLAALRTPGPYRVPEDPLVAITLKAEAEIEYLGQRFRTDSLGLRPRAGPPPAADAFHLVVLGDSVAYGQGLAPEQVLAAQLEQVLAGVRPDGAREVVCSTVAVPGWNPRNSTRHLLDHLDRIAPDLVLFVPVENDLVDSFAVSESGQRRVAGDPGVPGPLCTVAPPYEVFRHLGLEMLGPRAFARRESQLDYGAWSLPAGLTESGRFRLEDARASLVQLARRLERVGARLVLAPYAQHDLHRALRARLLEHGLDLPVLSLLDEFLHADGLGKDPHPNAETTRALALWAAEGLFAQGLLPFERARALPEIPARLAGRRARELAPAELVAWRAEYERAQAAALLARIAPAELLGVFQIYGGVNADGTLGSEAALVLPAGRRLRLELEGVLDAPGLYPLSVAVDAAGTRLGEVVVPAPAQPVAAEFALAPEQAAAPFEVRLLASDWGLGRVLDRRTPVSARLVAAESLP